MTPTASPLASLLRLTSAGENPAGTGLPEGQAGAAGADFTALLAGLSAAIGGREPLIDAAAATGKAATESGKGGKTGKILPLPVAGLAAEPEAKLEKAAEPAAEALLPPADSLAAPQVLPTALLLPMAAAPLPTDQNPASADDAASSSAAGLPRPALAVAPVPAANPTLTPSVAISLADGPVAAPAAALTPVSLPIDPAAEAPSVAPVQQQTPPAPAMTAVPAPAAPQAAFAAERPARASAAERPAAKDSLALRSEAADPAPAFLSSAPSQPQAVQPVGSTVAAAPQNDLAQIVDRLAAAREALAPAKAHIAIDHADFGALSLRIDQKADGVLSVQLAAATAEAHRAVGAALASSGGQFGNGDAPPQQQNASASTQSNAAPQGQASAGSSTASDRDARSGQRPDSRPDQGRDQPQEQAQRRREQQAPRDGRTAGSDGIFA